MPSPASLRPFSQSAPPSLQPPPQSPMGRPQAPQRYKRSRPLPFRPACAGDGLHNGPASRRGAAVTVPEPPDAVSAILEPYGAVRMRQDWEILVLEKLKWDLVAVIANDFLAHILYHLPLPKDKMELVKKHAQTFIALCATDHTFAMYPPSMIATGSIGAAIHGLTVSVNDFSGEAITELLASITGTEVDCLKGCQEQIEAALAESLKQASQTHQEYSTTKTAAYLTSQPTSTPTDVTDVNL